MRIFTLSVRHILFPIPESRERDTLVSWRVDHDHISHFTHISRYLQLFLLSTRASYFPSTVNHLALMLLQTRSLLSPSTMSTWNYQTMPKPPRISLLPSGLLLFVSFVQFFTSSVPFPQSPEFIKWLETPRIQLLTFYTLHLSSLMAWSHET